MSLWLSAANRVANTGRGLATAAARRQQTAITNEAAKSVVGFWSRALKTPSASRRPKGR